ncbi:hypothetical protein HJC23_007428 [Cyclotella cryptica]|uniref:Uncharacterized protein n=1 Tax=Cyclotella cryptica TaxID=29204 RepID=A0ABD3QHQ6_9STRA|eukprot:CCRYP_005180-RA/>CCRYP_005180-RA protein AED:0.00 eAED:-0.00 QI:0/-1/0/1/-1/1/1/0/692
MDDDIEQIIQWARESLQRHRVELQEKKRELVSIKKSHAPVQVAHDDNVRSILERGSALLAEAEVHSEILGQYTGRFSYEVEGHKGGHFMSRFSHAANDKHLNLNANANNLKCFSKFPVEKPSWNDHNSEDYSEDKSNDAGPSYHQNKGIEALFQGGEARVKLDNLITSIQRRGDNPAREFGRSQSAVKQVSSFDPNELRAAKRAALKKSKQDETSAAAEEETRILSSFKALPLPGGVHLIRSKHDIFAPTISFQGKHTGLEIVRRDTTRVGLCDFSSARSLGGFEGYRSDATSQTCIDTSSDVNGYRNEADKEQARQLRLAKKAIKMRLLDSVNKAVLNDIGGYSDDDANVAYSVHSAQSHVDFVEDPSKVRQKIARLEANLKMKRSQRSATLNDIVDIDLNSIFERLLPENADATARTIVERLKHQVCGNIVDGELVDNFKPHMHVTKKEEGQGKTFVGVLYKRQNDWVRQREQRLLEVKLKIEAEQMSGVTGMPELSHAKDSWTKAKNAHSEVLKKIAEEEERKETEKEERERKENEARKKEIHRLQKEATFKIKAIRCEVNQEEQMKRIERLSQPRKIRDGPVLLKQEGLNSSVDDSLKKQVIGPRSKNTLKATLMLSDTSHDIGNAEQKLNKKAQKSALASSEFVELSGKRFSDMDDKEFGKILKRISKLAAKRVRESESTNPNVAMF